MKQPKSLRSDTLYCISGFNYKNYMSSAVDGRGCFQYRVKVRPGLCPPQLTEFQLHNGQTPESPCFHVDARCPGGADGFGISAGTLRELSRCLLAAADHLESLNDGSTVN